MSRPVVVVEPGQGHRVGNVEFLARTEDTPFFNLAIVVLRPGQGVESHVHDVEDDSFLVLDGTLSLTVGDDDREVQAGPGTFVLVPAGTAHAIVNSGRDRRALPERPRTWWLRPADRAGAGCVDQRDRQGESGGFRTCTCDVRVRAAQWDRVIR